MAASSALALLVASALLPSTSSIRVLTDEASGSLQRLAQAQTIAEAPPTSDPGLSIRKPRNDVRNYSYTVLANGIRAFAVQDARSETAAASVAVSVGSLDDPEAFPGLSHFLEHMLFLGTKAHPELDGFQEFVAGNGGGTNAYTAQEATVYFYTVSAAVADEALERFAGFFESPLLDANYSEREVHAVDSEHSKNMQDPAWRIESMISEMASEQSALHHFGTGDLDTLWNIPKHKGLDLVEAVKTHWRTHYCPKRLHVVTFGPQDVQEQLQEVTQRFAHIEGRPDCSAQAPEHSTPPAWPAANLQQWVDMQGSSPVLTIFFPLPDTRPEYKTLPLRYIMHVLQDVSEGGLVSVLRDELNLAHTVSVDGDASSAGTVFTLYFYLTADGQDAPDKVAEVLFAYLASLRLQGVDEHLLASLLGRAHLAWDFKAPGDPESVVSGIAAGLRQGVDPNDILWSHEVPQDSSTSRTEELMGMLTPDKANYIFMDARPLGDGAEARGSVPIGGEVQILEHYDANFVKRSITEVFPEAFARWQGLSGLDEQQLASQLATTFGDAHALPVAPQPIPGLPHVDDVSLDFAGAAAAEDPRGPMPVEIDIVSPFASSTAYFRQGWVSNAPSYSPMVSVSVIFRVLEPKVEEPSAMNNVISSLYNKYVGEDLDTALAAFNGLAAWGVTVTPKNVQVQVTAYGEQMESALQKLLGRLSDGALVEVSGRVDRLEEAFHDELAIMSDMPMKYCGEDKMSLLSGGGFSREELLGALEKVDNQGVVTGLKDAFTDRRFEVTALAMGNLDEGQARTFIESVVDAIPDASAKNNGKAEGHEALVTTPMVKLNKPVEVRRLNQRAGDPNDVTLHSVQAGLLSVERQAVLGVLGKIWQSVAFTYLRTEEQLGYAVFGSAATKSNVMYISTLVQGTKLDADAVEAKIEYALSKVMLDHLENMTDDSVHLNIQALIEGLTKVPKDISQEVSTFWMDLTSSKECLDFHNKVAHYLTSVDKAALIDAWKTLITPTEGVRPKIVVKHFKDSNDAADIAERPSLETAKAAWQQAGVPAEQVALLEREYGESHVFDKADSASRATLLESDGVDYFPQDICHHEQGAAPPQGGGVAPAPAPASAVRAWWLSSRRASLLGGSLAYA